jgi:hypothetical protein
MAIHCVSQPWERVANVSPSTAAVEANVHIVRVQDLVKIHLQVVIRDGLYMVVVFIMVVASGGLSSKGICGGCCSNSQSDLTTQVLLVRRKAPCSRGRVGG